MSNSHEQGQPDAPNPRRPEASPPFPAATPRRRQYESPAYPTSDRAVSQADGSA